MNDFVDPRFEDDAIAALMEEAFAEDQEETKFDVEEYFNSSIDYWWKSVTPWSYSFSPCVLLAWLRATPSIPPITIHVLMTSAENQDLLNAEFIETIEQRASELEVTVDYYLEEFFLAWTQPFVILSLMT